MAPPPSITPDLLALVGNTPLLDLSRLSPNPHVRLLAKLEGFNPSGSLKDRITVRMVAKAEEAGRLTPGQTLLEPTSGNTGVSLALVGAAKGYAVDLVVSTPLSFEKRRMIRGLGARIIPTLPLGSADASIRHARELAQQQPQRYCLLDQYSNEDNVLAHYEGTGPEIWAQSGGAVDCLVAPLGTGGTLMGTGRFLKERNPDVQVVCVAPPAGGHIEGLRDLSRDMRPAIFHPASVDENVPVPPARAFGAARELMARTGLMAGYSSGAALVGAQEMASRLRSGTVVAVFPDRGDRYLGTALFEAPIRPPTSVSTGAQRPAKKRARKKAGKR